VARQAALARLQEFQAEPRKETLDVSAAQVSLAQASQKTANDTHEKQGYS